MSVNGNERSPADPFEEYDGDTYGEAFGFDESTGDFLRSERGGIEIVEGPEMVANQLVRTLRTPVGDDPFRPEYGLDKQEFLGTHEHRTKQALIDAIGPEADPRVGELVPGDITVDYGGDRDASVTVSMTLVDGTPLEFTAQFRALLGVES